MNPMQNKTPEERKAIAAKALATRRARREAKETARQAREEEAGEARMIQAAILILSAAAR